MNLRHPERRYVSAHEVGEALRRRGGTATVDQLIADIDEDAYHVLPVIEQLVDRRWATHRAGVVTLIVKLGVS